MALRILAHCLGSAFKQERPRSQLLHRADGPQAHQLRALRVAQAGAFGHGLANAVFGVRDHTIHPDVQGRGAPVDLGMGDMALFEPQHVQRLHSVSAAAHRLGPRDQQIEQRRAKTSWHGDFIGMFARE